MNFKNNFVFAILILLNITCTGQEKCMELYKSIFTKTADKNVYNEVYLKGKDAIPCLLSFIDTNNKSVVGIIDPRLSYIPPFVFNNYRGIDAAYLIELILSTDSLVNDKSGDWRQQINPYKIYNYCVIVKMQESKPILKPLDYEDMKAIKTIYSKWWEANKDKSIEELRKAWKENKHILDGSNYKWI